jgi:hypothetical protein
VGSTSELQGLVSQVGAWSQRPGEVFRLQASVASEERAREVCRVLAAGRQGCVYVPPVAEQPRDSPRSRTPGMYESFLWPDRAAVFDHA